MRYKLIKTLKALSEEELDELYLRENWELISCFYVGEITNIHAVSGFYYYFKRIEEA